MNNKQKYIDKQKQTIKRNKQVKQTEHNTADK